MLSLTCKAAIKSVIYLVSSYGAAHKPGIQEIASHIHENAHTVGKLLQKLVKEGIINSTKGPNGGFYVNESQRSQSVIHVVVAIDGNGVFEQCGLGLSTCSETHPCPFHNDYKPVREMFERMCREKTMLDLYQNLHDGQAFLASVG
ncbi:MAG: Rrf2 family transcriptional regulator [Bacteroidetes bacterium]|jgi:Rrf2 family protein|nr:Rrf2 family transcriptional regulator [Bacteroidota bacterium]